MIQTIGIRKLCWGLYLIHNACLWAFSCATQCEMSGRKPWIETVLPEIIWLLPVVHCGFYSKTAKKEVCFQWKWTKKVHATGKWWLPAHPQSIHVELFCWIKSIEYAHVTRNLFYPTQKQFVNAVLHFLRNTIPKKWTDFRSQVSDNFRNFSPKLSGFGVREV